MRGTENLQFCVISLMDKPLTHPSKYFFYIASLKEQVIPVSLDLMLLPSNNKRDSKHSSVSPSHHIYLYPDFMNNENVFHAKCAMLMLVSIPEYFQTFKVVRSLMQSCTSLSSFEEKKLFWFEPTFLAHSKFNFSSSGANLIKQFKLLAGVKK